MLVASGAKVGVLCGSEVDEDLGPTPHIQTALDVAAMQGVKYGRADLVDAVLPAVRKAEGKSGWGSTPLHVPAAVGCLEILQALLECKAEVNTVDKYGQSALHHAACWRACRVGKNRALKALLAANAQANLADSEGRTALHEALRSGSAAALEQAGIVAQVVPTVKALLAARAQIDLVDNDGVSARKIVQDNLAGEFCHGDIDVATAWLDLQDRLEASTGVYRKEATPDQGKFTKAATQPAPGPATGLAPGTDLEHLDPEPEIPNADPVKQPPEARVCCGGQPDPCAIS